MICPRCKADSNVINSRMISEIRRRRYECPSCGLRFNTREQVVEKTAQEKEVERMVQSDIIQALDAAIKIIEQARKVLEKI